MTVHAASGSRATRQTTLLGSSRTSDKPALSWSFDASAHWIQQGGWNTGRRCSCYRSAMIELLQQVIKDGLPTAHNSPLSDRFFFCFRMEECSAGGYALRSGSLADAPQRMKGKLVSPRGLADSCMKPILRPSASKSPEYMHHHVV